MDEGRTRWFAIWFWRRRMDFARGMRPFEKLNVTRRRGLHSGRVCYAVTVSHFATVKLNDRSVQPLEQRDCCQQFCAVLLAVGVLVIKLTVNELESNFAWESSLCFIEATDKRFKRATIGRVNERILETLRRRMITRSHGFVADLQKSSRRLSRD